MQRLSASIAFLLLAWCLALPGYGASTRSFDIAIRNGAVAGNRTARVTRGDTAILRWTSDAPVELHLHGYDVTVTVAPGGVAEMRVEARATGRFPIEAHGKQTGGHAHQPLFFLEVYPE
ncbi:MAG TPA: hypothetical protein VFZ14_18840 [Burkholderiales bacterium]|nr:hypothetical protein [Burkholderiales bacterium]